MRKIAIVIVILLAAGAAGWAQGKVLNVPLRWTPKESPDIPAVDLTGVVASLKVDPMQDKREDSSVIGENPEKKPPVRVVTTTDVAGFVRDHLVTQLKNLGFSVSGTSGDRTLQSELLQFWVRDTGSYEATIRVKLTVRDASGTELWTGVVSGKGGNWGRQLKVDNYNETISDAVLDLVANLAKASEFRATLRQKW